ncbi:MAG: hypothetical protein ABSB18_05595 [Candidatus Omnitrophota bacterium]
MKAKVFIAAVSFAVVCLFAFVQRMGVSYADSPRGRDRDHGRNRFYRHYRFYPSDYYLYRKIYYLPLGRYYYYYDVYPEKVYYYETEKVSPSVNPNYLPLTSIANMASQGVPDEVIISEIERTHSIYKLNIEIITYLKQNGAGSKLIDYMLSPAEYYKNKAGK